MMTTELRYKRQDYNRDMFLFSCFTGICYADMASLTYDRIEQDAQGEWWISGNRQKTETKYVVKLLPYALFILNKYRGLTGDGRVFAMSTLDSIDDSLKTSPGSAALTNNSRSTLPGTRTPRRSACRTA